MAKTLENELISAQAVAKYIRISPTKVQQVINLIRYKNVEEAAAILKFTPKAAARSLSKVLASAVANAEFAMPKKYGVSVSRSRLYISEAFVNEGPTLKRIRPRAMGRAFRVRKRTSHITIVVSLKEG